MSTDVCNKAILSKSLIEFECLLNAHTDLVEFKSFDHNLNDNTMTVEYVHIPYDMIDADLDYDEEHYANMMLHFDKTVEMICLKKVQDQIVSMVTTNIYRMIYRGNNELKVTLKKVLDKSKNRMEHHMVTYSCVK